ncbi:cytochrome P450 [Microlunatus sp. Gsoil 973]|uniref:cytochrome P450 n=1 Tax=Microlunatus sp. Gsoil 973 TaxID=2672569 RepID=UPI0012B46E75|nr:cytochrome P450 [Microlunatus sp. Gsoil 973]QGN35124.1 cytochrome P450 [Microlunatus sp. Gsoil 973]
MAIGRQQVAFIRELYGTRLRVAYQGHVRRNPAARLLLEAGRQDPYPIYEQIRRRGLLVPTPLGNHATVSHAACNEVLRSRNFGVGQTEGRDNQLSLLDLDPPDHTRLRRLVAPDFTSRRIPAFAPRVQSVLDDLIKKLPRDEPFDLVSSFAAPLPIAVITDLLGIPDANAEEFAMHGARFGSALGGIQSLAHARELMATRARLAEIFTEIFELRRQEPKDDLIGRIVAANQSSTEAVRPEEMVPLCTLLLIAGFETTVNLIGNTVLALLSHPDQWRLFTEQPELADKVVEEGLRYDPPVQRTGRMAMVDTEVLGRPVARGEFVMTALGGANRDPAVFTDPGRFDITRSNAGEHLSFSGGIHYCVGAPLARLEASMALRTIATEFPDLQPAGKRVRRAGSLIRGMQHFPVSVPRARQTTIV